MKSIAKLNKSYLDNLFKESKQVMFCGEKGAGTTYAMLQYAKEELGIQYDKLPDEEKKSLKNAYDMEHFNMCEGNPYIKMDDPIYKEDYVEKHMKFVSLHHTCEYEYFIEGIRPVQTKEGGTTSVRMDGIFKGFCRDIVENKSSSDEKWFFIMDRVINDTSLENVFGETMHCLDEAYRGEKYHIDTKYQNIVTYKAGRSKAERLSNDCFKDGFYIPQNLYIIAAMEKPQPFWQENYHTALYRIFQMVDIYANDEMEHVLLEMLNGVIEEAEIKRLSERVCNMNHILAEYGKKIKSNLPTVQIGPVYFKTYNGSNLKHIFDHHIAFEINGYNEQQLLDEQDNKLLDKCWNALSGANDGQE